MQVRVCVRVSGSVNESMRLSVRGNVSVGLSLSMSLIVNEYFQTYQFKLDALRRGLPKGQFQELTSE